MRRTPPPTITTVCLLAVVVLSPIASAQPGGGSSGAPGFSNTNSRSHLLELAEDEAVWDEIRLSDEQLGKLTRLGAAIRRQSRLARDAIRVQVRQGTGGTAGATGQPPDPAAVEAAREAARQAERLARAENSAMLRQESEAALKKILKADQVKRVQQIDLQEAGPLVVARPDVAQTLNLTSEQVEQILGIIGQMGQGQERLRAARREMSRSLDRNRGNANGTGPPPSPAEQQARREQVQLAIEKTRAQSLSLKDDAIAQVGRILTKTQRAKFHALLGKPFDVTLLNEGNGPNNPFNPGGNGNRGPGGGGPSPLAARPPGGAGSTGTSATADGAASKGATSSGTTGRTSGSASPKTGATKGAGSAKTASPRGTPTTKARTGG